MNEGKKTMKIFYWLPRVLAIVFICFLALFALDVFIPHQTIGYYAVSLFMHLIPNFILLAILVIAWRDEFVGGALFIVAAVFFTLFFQTYLTAISFLLITIPILTISGLFLAYSYFFQIQRKVL